MSTEKDVVIQFSEKEIVAGQELHGNILINYKGRFDSLVINSQIEKSSDVFSYVNLNGKKINYPYARISIFKADLGDRRSIDFVAVTKHIPQSPGFSNVKFRASVIQEHKEVASDVAYIKIVA